MATSDAPLNVPNVTLAVAIKNALNNSGPITVPNFGASEDPTYPLGITAGSYFVDGDNGSDANNGVRTVDGGTGPFATISKAFEVLSAGDTCYVRQSTTPYSFLGTIQGSTLVRGHVFANSGAEGQYIRLYGYPGEMPVIDQQNSAAGIQIPGKSHIQILNFEIRNCTGAGVYLPSGVQDVSGNSFLANNIVVKYCHIHSIDGPENQNIACIMARDAYSLNFSENKLHTVRVGGVLNPNGALFNMYDTRDYKIEHNTMYDADSGIIHKTPADAVIDVGTVRLNKVYNVDKAFYYNDNPATGVEEFFNNLYITQNVVYDATAFFYDTVMNTVTPSQSLFIFNNTLIDCDFSIRGFQDVRLFNNILYGTGSRIQAQADNVDLAEWHLSKITDIGHNLWDIGGGVHVTLDVYHPTLPTRTYTTLSGWQNASADSPATLVDTSPGAGSIVGSALFVDATTRNYKLQSGSPAINAGRDGTTMGAYITGNEQIGVSW